jgi:hypothetical protein
MATSPVAPPPAEPTVVPNPRVSLLSRIRSKKALNRFAVKALESADVVLGSIPVAQVAAEIKDVALIAIKD